MSDINLQVGAGSKFSALNLKDDATGGFIAATFSNVSVQNSNPEFATIQPNPSNPNGSIKASPLAEGSGTAVISAHVDYINPGDGLPKSEDKSVTKTFTVAAAAHSTSLEVNF